MIEYSDLEVHLQRRDTASYRVVLRISSPRNDAEDYIEGSMAFDLTHLKEHLAGYPEYGRSLARHLFSDNTLLNRYDKATQDAQESDVPLRVRLFIDTSAPELHDLLWETLRHPVTDALLFTNPGIYFSRFLSCNDWQVARIRPWSDLRTLALIANPADLSQYGFSPLDVACEKDRLQRALNSLPVKPTILAASGVATLKNLSDALRTGYDILYIICHGSQMNGETFLWFEDHAGKSHRVSGDALSACLRELRQRPRLVVLSACQTAGDGQMRGGESLSRLGPRLAREGIPAVLAMNGNVQINTAELFTPVFFRELLHNGQIDRAMTIARSAIRDQPDFWAPVLFTRLQSGRLWYDSKFVGARQDTHGDGDNKWEELIRFVNDQACTPILGPDLSEGFLGSRRELAWNLAEACRYPLKPQDREDLSQVAEYLAVAKSSHYLHSVLVEHLHHLLLDRLGTPAPAPALAIPINTPLEEKFNLLNRLVLSVWQERAALTSSDAYHSLAQLPFKIYLTADPSDVLLEALKQAGKEPQIEICPWNDYALQLVLDKRKRERRTHRQPSLKAPLVYYLFGRLAEYKSLVLTEDAFFDYLINVERNRDLVPSSVRNALVDGGLIFMGFHADDWNFRTFFRTLINQEGRRRSNTYSHVAVQIAPDEGRILNPRLAQKYFEEYFEKGGQISVYWGHAEEFARQLVHRYERKNARAQKVGYGPTIGESC